MDRKGKNKKWIDAVVVLEKNPQAEIVCPECQNGILQIKDEPIKVWKKIDRYLICSSCGKWNVATMNDPDNQ